jgi:ATP-dependent Clp protease protease subunit
MAVHVNGQELTLSGTVGEMWFDDGFTHTEVVTALAELEGDITVRLNSGGGIASEGAAINSALATYDGKVDVVIEGIAASAASLIAMAGTTITMTEGAVMMIHDPLNMTIGNSADHAKTIEGLEAFATVYSRVYAKRSGKTAAECRDIMKAETWFTGEQAVAAGFADKTGTTKSKAVAAFDYRAYAHAPKRLTAQAKARNWSIADHQPDDAASAIDAPADKEINMALPTDKERADALALEVATLTAAKAIAETALSAATAAATQATLDAVAADRKRGEDIDALPEAKGREALAKHLFTEGFTVDKAKAMLAVSPAAVAAVTEPVAPVADAAALASAALSRVAPVAADNHGWGKVIASLNATIKR